MTFPLALTVPQRARLRLAFVLLKSISCTGENILEIGYNTIDRLSIALYAKAVASQMPTSSCGSTSIWDALSLLYKAISHH